MSIKCFINGTATGAAATSTDCPTTPADSKICARISVYTETSVVRNYLCVPEAGVTNVTYTDAVTDDLICKNITVSSTSSEYCFCKKEDCNNINILTSPVKPLKVSRINAQIIRHLNLIEIFSSYDRNQLFHFFHL